MQPLSSSYISRENCISHLFPLYENKNYWQEKYKKCNINKPGKVKVLEQIVLSFIRNDNYIFHKNA